jgi:hypothetical protein
MLKLYSVELKADKWIMNRKWFGRKWSLQNFKLLSQHSSGGIEENNEKPQSVFPISRSRFEPGTSRGLSRNFNHSNIDNSLTYYLFLRFVTPSSGLKIKKYMEFRIVFWDVLPCKIIVDRRFRGTCCLHHQGFRSSTIILHGSISQKTTLNIILAAVRTWNLTKKYMFFFETIVSAYDKSHIIGLRFLYIISYVPAGLGCCDLCYRQTARRLSGTRTRAQCGSCELWRLALCECLRRAYVPYRTVFVPVRKCYPLCVLPIMGSVFVYLPTTNK